ncbi:NAD(P)-binding domain-containing protein [uncultured Winogradskyella sp.]|uniref:NAD(P)-binding domain-containing protein n=1 Tax=uncultured Winogradskyella sp. TaxID=395353 RepID=UPI0026238E4F|nr:NAD(P)-binding domain-containing protein [uncultured Winogradskyella sp.]
MNSHISIIGCGWLGFPLAKSLIKKGYKIKGSTTSNDKLKLLINASIKGYLVQLTEAEIVGDSSGFIDGSNTVIINVPPGLRRNPSKNHIAEIEHFIKVLEKHQVKNVLYISSTTVFKNEERLPLITDTTLPNATSKIAQQLITIERMLSENSNFNTTILRFGGLIGAQRHPGKYLSGKDNIPNPSAPLNLIHLKDCIGIISEIIDKNMWNTTFNAAYPHHPKKEDYYVSFCKGHKLPLPRFNNKELSKGKRIKNNNLEQLLNYKFKHAI